MRGFWKRFLLWLCVSVLLVPAGALAEFSPRWDALLQGGSMTVTVSAALDSADGVGKESLDILNGWLSRLQGQVSQGQNSQAELLLDGESLLSASVQRQNAYHLTVFEPSGNAYLTDPQRRDALQLLAEGQNGLPDATVLPKVYAAVAAPLYGALETAVTPKTVKEATSVKNAASSASYINYVFKSEALNEVWPHVLTAVLPVLRETLADQPVLYAEWEETLSALIFFKECRFKRLLDKEGKDMGLQFTGQAAKGEDKRKVTLFGGFTPDRGGYISLSLPAVSGKNNLKASLGVKLTAKNGVNTLTAEGSLNSTYEGVTRAYTLEGSLKNTVKEEEEAWTGKITWTETENKVKTTWTLTPALTLDDGGLNGQVAFLKKEGRTTVLKGAVNVSLRASEEISSPAAFAAKDLRQMPDAEARTAVQAELAPLTGALARLFSALPEGERTQLMHTLRTDAWMNGPAAPVKSEPVPIQSAGIETNQAPGPETDGDWVVEENEP